jgi:RNA polymerase sigma-70 factor (ECF subfamily)
MEGDAELVSRLRAGDESAFVALVDAYSPGMLRLAMLYAPSRAVAEEVVQETWIGVLRGIDGFEGRSSLKTWIFRILTNTAKTRAERESRTVPFSSAWGPSAERGEPSIDAGAFLPPDDARWPSMWASSPASWGPEEQLLGTEAREQVEAAIAALPRAQREVITLRDVEGLDGTEVCELLELSDGNQRVLLHRARAGVRRAIERHVSEQ